MAHGSRRKRRLIGLFEKALARAIGLGRDRIAFAIQPISVVLMLDEEVAHDFEEHGPVRPMFARRAEIR